MKIFKKLIQEEGPVGEFATGYVESSRFSSSDFGYPDLERVSVKDGVHPEWFYEARDKGSGPTEMGAIHQYINNSFAFEEYGDLALGIALVEMVHLDKLSDLIIGLGGTNDRRWGNRSQKFAKTVKEAVENDLKDELDTIKDYEKLVEKLRPIKTDTGITAFKLMRKLLEDEKHHAKLLREFLNKL